MYTRLILLLLALIPELTLHASGIRGHIHSEDGEPLGFATIFVRQTGTGAVSNEEGFYEINLPSGSYEIVYQYVGYETQVRTVELSRDFVTINVALKPQVTLLKPVTVEAGNEDPAYTIMRKAIAKAGYHRNQLDAYSATVYIKGTGKLVDYPWIAKRALEREGVEKGRVYISESVSEIQYTRPNRFDEKVISIYSDGKDNNTSPNPFIFGSFYEPEIAQTISPLSPRAFAYYRFEYLGTFRDRDYEVSRIRVTPRSRGDNVVEGTIFIVEDAWSIHSLDVTTTKLGINIRINSMYAPIEDKVWLPVSFHFTVDGKVFGFEFEYNYLASLSNYSVTLNPEVYVEPRAIEVIDEKIERDRAEAVQHDPGGMEAQVRERLESNKEITRKQLRTLMKEYEKEEQRRQEQPEVVAEITHRIDSNAYQKDSAYWSRIRPIPLTEAEVYGYRKMDSLAKVEAAQAMGDTLRPSRHRGFQLWDVLVGDRYELSEHSNLSMNPGGGFNTVEGFYAWYKFTFGTTFRDSARSALKITPTFRYAFSARRFNARLETELRQKNSRLTLAGGRYVSQYNADNPIWYIVNTFTTLFLEKNLMKLYERDYINLRYNRKINPYLSVYGNADFSRRRELSNTSDFKFLTNDNVEGYTPNRPVNSELDDTGFPTHNAFVATIGLTARPWMKYVIRNGVKTEIANSSPTFSIEYQRGLKNVFNSDVDFDRVELNARHTIRTGARGTLALSATGGYFPNSDKLYFMDYKHFPGNLTPFTTSDPVASFRLMDYYLYSTADKYFSASAHYQFRKFLATQWVMVRMTGVRENVFVNYLATPYSKNYTEVGYTIDGILRFFRLEFAAAFQEGRYIGNGFRIGVTTTLQIGIQEN